MSVPRAASWNVTFWATMKTSDMSWHRSWLDFLTCPFRLQQPAPLLKVYPAINAAQEEHVQPLRARSMRPLLVLHTREQPAL